MTRPPALFRNVPFDPQRYRRALYGLFFFFIPFWEPIPLIDWLYFTVPLGRFEVTFKPLFLSLGLFAAGVIFSRELRADLKNAVRGLLTILSLLGLFFLLFVLSAWWQGTLRDTAYLNLFCFFIVFVVGLTGFYSLKSHRPFTLDEAIMIFASGCFVYGVTFFAAPERFLDFRLSISLAFFLFYYFFLRSVYEKKLIRTSWVRWLLAGATLFLVHMLLMANGRASIFTAQLGCVLTTYYYFTRWEGKTHGKRWRHFFTWLFIILFCFTVPTFILDRLSQTAFRQHLLAIVTDPYPRDPNLQIQADFQNLENLRELQKRVRQRSEYVVGKDRVSAHKYILKFWDEFVPLGLGIRHHLDYRRLNLTTSFIGVHSSYLTVIASAGYLALLLFLLSHFIIFEIRGGPSIFSVIYLMLFLQGLTDTRIYDFTFWFCFSAWLSMKTFYPTQD